LYNTVLQIYSAEREASDAGGEIWANRDFNLLLLNLNSNGRQTTKSKFKANFVRTMKIVTDCKDGNPTWSGSAEICGNGQ
jgi:hypothetical protein